jgi:hypothetical protein
MLRRDGWDGSPGVGFTRTNSKNLKPMPMQPPSLISTLKVIGTVTLLLFVCCLIPYTSTEIPQWRIQVVDSNVQPVANADVRQYALFWGRQEIWSETQTTNEQGRATFPARTIRVSLARRAFARMVAHYVHLPYGPSAAPGFATKVVMPALDLWGIPSMRTRQSV